MELSGAVRKAVIVAAGWGTRFLPVTKSVPKEMLPLIDKPLIQYVVKEAVDSGIKIIIIITASGKQSIEDYFDYNYELEAFLEHKGKKQLLKGIRAVADMASFSFVRQKERKGLGHAILAAKDVVGNEPFAVILPDDIIVSKHPVLKQMIDTFKTYRSVIIAVEKITISDSQKYGIIRSESVGDNVYTIKGLVEKPTPESAPSDLGIVGRYILTPEIFNALETTKPDIIGEIQLTDALQILLEEQQILALEFSGQRFDTGNPLGLIQAQISFGLDHPKYSTELINYMRGMIEVQYDCQDNMEP
jgi:UTP--glucose-1-phosphate uridylyltransferase